MNYILKFWAKARVLAWQLFLGQHWWFVGAKVDRKTFHLTDGGPMCRELEDSCAGAMLVCTSFLEGKLI